MDYKNLYERARKQLPEKVFEQSRFEIPNISSVIEGNKTFIVNIRDVLERINRGENHFLKFMAGELATSVTMEGTRAVFAGKACENNTTDTLRKVCKGICNLW